MFEAISLSKKIRLTIEKEEGLGFYLYMYELGKEISKEDHLCDNLEQVFLVAEEDYGIPKRDFRKI